MLTLPAIIGLIVYIIVRPFYFIPSLGAVPFLYIFFALAVLGLVIDLGQRRIQWKTGPHLWWAAALLLWILATAAIRSPGYVVRIALTLMIPISLYVLIAHGITSFKSYSRVTGSFLACTLLVSVVCIYQGTRPLECIEFAEGQASSDSVGAGRQTGRDCATELDCYVDREDFEFTYRCEHAGPGPVHSVTRRVRYVGVLHDPNETALAVSLGVPIAIARFQRRRGAVRFATLIATLVLAAIAVVMSMSRGGQLVFAVTLGVYFVSRYRWKGMALGVLLAIPVLIYGGRSSDSAEESTTGRLGVQMDGIQMFLSSPIRGVGYGRYGENSEGTAHNSFVFAPAEFGIVGMATWAILLWISFKIVLQGLRYAKQVDDEEARTWGLALMSALSGMTAGIAFLTFNFHFVFWIMLGLSGAYYAAFRERHPAFRIQVGLRDLALVTFGNLGLLAGLYLLVRIRGGG